MKAEFTKFGPKHDYRGAHVTMEYQGQTLIGTVRDVYRRDVTGSVHCKVQHFCGDFWPVEPCLRLVDILERSYEEAVS